MAGIPTEASILALVDKAIPGKVLNVYNPPAGGGKLATIMQIRKEVEADEGIQRQAAILALSAFKELKTVILVDEDVDIFDMNDVMWTLNTRFQGDKDVIVLPECAIIRSIGIASLQSRRHSLSGHECQNDFRRHGPFDMKEHFVRAKFKEVSDWQKYLD